MTLRLVIMGVSGCGKSTVGSALALQLGVTYRDGDDLHPPANVAKMAAGTALSDDDRWPWLDRVAQVLAQEAPVIVGCSALKRIYRDRLRAGAGAGLRFVHLAGSREVIAARMVQRTGHYMPLSLLDSQFAALEPPSEAEAIIAPIDQPFDALVTNILARLEEVTP